jgi:hypothetical protein
MEELAKQLGYNIAPFIYAAAAYRLFRWLDETASDEAKAALARTMRFKDYKNEQVASALVEVFDRIYSIRCCVGGHSVGRCYLRPQFRQSGYTR